MRCPNCGREISFQKKVCSSCNANLTKYRSLISISNRYYNDAVYKARVRDLSGAIVSLKQSLQVNKKNTNARNLLGLVYYEMGETVSALGEWIISKNYQEEQNVADYYLKVIQNNTSKLSATNANIKKYNYGLSQARSGNYDVALLQLKKVVSVEPKYLKAQQLLALLYMEKGDNDKAARCLRKAQQIDITNTTTLRYLAELGLNPSAVKVEREIARRNQTKGQELETAEELQFGSPGPILRDGKINKWSFIYLIIGVIIGLLAVVFLALPTRESALVRKYNKEAVEMAEEQSNLSSQIQTLENDKSQLNGQISDLNDEIVSLQEEALDVSSFNKFLKGVDLFITGEKEQAAEILVDIDVASFDSKAAKALYDSIKEDCFCEISDDKTKQGYNASLNRNYADAEKQLKEALRYNKDNDQAMYYLGQMYENSGDNENALKWYRKVVKGYVTSKYYRASQSKIDILEEEE